MSATVALTCVLAGSMVAGQPASGAETVTSGRQSAVVTNASGEVDGIPTFGPNSPVELIGGFLPVFNCLDPVKNDRSPVLITTTDIIVRRKSSADSAGGQKVATVTTAPALGGLSLGTSVGITGPTGMLTTGFYDVVFDECQDGDYTPGQDAVFANLFRVLVPVDAAVIDLGDTKKFAAEVADFAKAWSTVKKLKDPLILMAKAAGAESTSDVSAVRNWRKLLKGKAPVSSSTATDLVSAYARQIANDPPDPAYAQITTVRPTPKPAFRDEVADSAERVAALQEALLHALERYQGAAAVRDGYWALVHARAISSYSRSLADAYTLLGPAMAQDAQTQPDPAVPARLAALAAAGLTGAQRLALRNDGLSESEVTAFEKEFRGTDFAATNGPDGAAAVTGFIRALSALASAATTAAGRLQADPNTGAAVPVADAGGPYPSTGGSITLDASASVGVGLGYHWDLDADGRFDDADGVRPQVAAGPAGMRLAGLEVVDAGGHRSTAYARISVTDDAGDLPPQPADPFREVQLGTPLNLSLATARPVSWQVDGVAAADGAGFRYAPVKVTEIGNHRITAGTGPNVYTWFVTVRGDDADRDGWHVGPDCDDRAAAVNPGRAELAGDGLDNDCDPLTLDGDDEPAQVTVRYPTFADPAGLAFNGTAEPSGDVIRMTTTTDQSASMWSTTPIAGNASFSSTFDVALHDGSDPPADGIVFAIQSSADGVRAGGRAGEGIGYGGVTPSVAVEFDTWRNAWDPDANHVAIDLNGDVTAPVQLAQPPFALYGTPFRAKVDYDASTKTLSVYVGQNGAVPASPLLSTTVDLQALLGTAYVGFTAGTGSNREVADLTSWQFEGARVVSRPTVPELSLTTTAGRPVSATLHASIAPVTYTIETEPGHGTVAVSGDRLTYTPAAGFSGPDVFAYATPGSAPALVHIQVDPAAGAPVIAPISPVTSVGTVEATAPGTQITLTARGLPPFATFTDQGDGHGIVVVDAARAAPGRYQGTVTATNSAGSATAPVVVVVPGNRPPKADSLTATTTGPVTVTVKGTDPDGDNLTYALRTPPARGKVTSSGAAFTYTPEAGFSGKDGFTVAVGDGTAVTVISAQITVAAADGGGGGVTLDKVVWSDGPLTAPKLDAPARDLILTTVSLHGPRTPLAGGVTSVTGGGLHWTRSTRAIGICGVTDIWYAYATRPFSGRVTAHTRRPAQGLVTVAAFSGAANRPAATASTVGAGTHPQVALTTRKPGSLIWSGGHSCDDRGVRAADPGLTTVHQWKGSWTQYRAQTPAGRTTLGVARGRLTRWQITAVEVPKR